MSLEFTFQKSGWYRQNQNAVLVFVFIILWSLSFHVFLSTNFPPNLEACSHYWFCEVLYSQSFVSSSFDNRLHTPLCQLMYSVQKIMLTFLRISNLLRVKMEICSKFDIAHYFTYFNLLNTTGIIQI